MIFIMARAVFFRHFTFRSIFIKTLRSRLGIATGPFTSGSIGFEVLNLANLLVNSAVVTFRWCDVIYTVLIVFSR